MFTGIITDIGSVLTTQTVPGGARMHFKTQTLSLSEFQLGESIAVNGCCLTIVERDDMSFVADVSHETLACTNLAMLTPDSPVNVEPALKVGQPLGGHFVSGHVDGVGTISHIDIGDGASTLLKIRVPAVLLPLLAVKGSVCINGVSLTVNHIEADVIAVNLVPHTMHHTTFQFLKKNDVVNIEIDLIARYIQRILSC